MNLQPVLAYFLPDAWSIGYSGNILANWENPASDTFTVPIGVSVAKVVKLGKTSGPPRARRAVDAGAAGPVWSEVERSDWS